MSIIIPTRDRLDLLRPCVDSILRHAPRYPGLLERLIVDKDSTETATASYFAQLADAAVARVVCYHGEFNWSAINNVAAREAAGEVLIFLNNITVVRVEA